MTKQDNETMQGDEPSGSGIVGDDIFQCIRSMTAFDIGGPPVALIKQSVVEITSRVSVRHLSSAPLPFVKIKAHFNVADEHVICHGTVGFENRFRIGIGKHEPYGIIQTFPS